MAVEISESVNRDDVVSLIHSTVPSRIHDLLMARLDRLGDAKQVAQLGGTIGREFPFALLEAVLNLDGVPMRIPDLPSQLDTLLESGLVIPVGDPRELLVQKCDVLVPAALERVIDASTAARLQCRVLAEAANGPTTPDADEVLDQRRGEIFVIPDILANAGGVTTSYFEWVQDRQGYFWKESVVNEQLEEIMISSFGDVVRYAETHKVNNRIAAYMLAIDRVAYTIRQRGIYA